MDISVYIEIGKKRAIASALEWPGWCRGGRDEASALQALFDYAPRYAQVLRPAGLEFHPPAGVSAFAVVERLDGNATTDFGAPGLPPSYDAQPIDKAELRRLQDLLQACWQAFDGAIKAAAGRELRLGPRGGGRSLDKIILHVLEADVGYLSRLGWKFPKGETESLDESLSLYREATLDALSASARGEMPAQGPRGGARWTLRYFVRRTAWHVLDHGWEIEDRVV